MSGIEFTYDDSALMNRFNKVTNNFPQKAEDLISNTAELFIKDIIDEEKRASLKGDLAQVNNLTNSKGYSKGKIRKSGDSIEIDIYTKSDQLNLIENGYELTDENGKKVGWVPGNFVVKQVVDSYDSSTAPLGVVDLLNQIEKDSGLA
jgi:hypothetical protein